MTIQITQPEVEALMNQCLQSGKFRNAEDVILQALRSLPASTLQSDTTPPVRRKRLPGRKSLVELFAESPLHGLDFDFSRNRSTGRPVDLL